MPSTQLAAQMYTLREFTKTPQDIAQTLKKVKQLGYDAVQLSALGPIDPKELARILQGEGLECCVTHVALNRMRDETDAVIEEHHMWGCKYTAIGGFNPKENVTAQTWVDLARDYNAVAKKFAGSGITLGYHNHSHELVKYDGKQALQILIENFDPSLWMEIDTYWITHGGGDPADWISRCKGRVPCIHVKDMAIKRDRTQYMAEVGEGNLNWPGILTASKAAGVEWYIVEQDICYRDPFESLGISLKNLKAMGLK